AGTSGLAEEEERSAAAVNFEIDFNVVTVQGRHQHPADRRAGPYSSRNGQIACALDFDDISLGAFDKRQYFATFLLRNLERIERRVEMADKIRPIAAADLHTLVRQRHIASGIIDGSTGTGA